MRSSGKVESPLQALTTHQIIKPEIVKLNDRGYTSITFRAFQIDFHLLLHPDFFTPLPKVEVVAENKTEILEAKRSMVGRVHGCDDSEVSGTLNEHFNGTIRIGKDTYFIEPLIKYNKNATDSTLHVIYRDRDLNLQLLCSEVREGRDRDDSLGRNNAPLLAVSLPSSERTHDEEHSKHIEKEK